MLASHPLKGPGRPRRRAGVTRGLLDLDFGRLLGDEPDPKIEVFRAEFFRRIEHGANALEYFQVGGVLL
jgi:hypothetical protein